MKVLIDADGCPVVDITIQIAHTYALECIIISDTSHAFIKAGVQTITVSQGRDSADFELIKRANDSDIVVTQDYGLAAMCLAKRARPINQDGKIYTDENIDFLLNERYIAGMVRRVGGRMKGKSKRSKVQNDEFVEALKALILA